MISVKGLIKSFGDLEVLKGISTEVAAGQVIARGTPEAIQQDDTVITSYLGRGRAVNE